MTKLMVDHPDRERFLEVVLRVRYGGWGRTTDDGSACVFVDVVRAMMLYPVEVTYSLE